MPISLPKKADKTPEKVKLKKKKNQDEAQDKVKGPKRISKKEEKQAPAANAMAWLEKVNKDRRFQGKAQIRMASQVKTPYNLRRPSGILSLDIALGGGLHAGGVVELQGIKSAGKTFLAYTFAAKVQEIYKEKTNILIYAVEIRTDKDFARMAGLKIAYSEEEIEETDMMRIASGQKALTEDDKEDLRTQVGNIIIVVADTAESGLSVVEDALRKFGGFQLVIIESLGAFLTKEGEEHDIGDKLFGGSTIAMTSFMNKIYPLFMMDRDDGSMLETTVLGINQARAKIGATRFERAERAAMGAHAWQHAQLVNVLLERGAKLRDGEKGPVVGRSVNFTLEKGKAGTHDGKSGSYNYYYLPKMSPVFVRDLEKSWYGGIDAFTDLAETVKGMGMLQLKGSWCSYKLGKQEYRAQSIEKFAQQLSETPALAEHLRSEAFKQSGILVRNT
jgi:RecA/RadA recombinase